MPARKEPLLSLWPFSSGTSGNAVSASNPDYQWPSLIEESREMLEASVLIYGFSDLRTLARKGLLTGGDQGAIDRLLVVPVKIGDVMQVLSANRENLRKSLGEENVDFYLSALESIQQGLQQNAVPKRGWLGGLTLRSAHLEAFDDENSSSELVYGISVNEARKRITVAFRGSVTATDFLTDANSFMSDIPNPTGHSPKTIGVHHGFYDYLFGSTRSNKIIKKASKCDVIMAQVIALMEKYPGYMLYVTGHSLGGALATLFAFEAAASKDVRMNKPVTCISVAAPKVGNLAFRQAFQDLEKQGSIRCLRVANYKDLVTLLPDRGSLSCLYIACCQSSVYRHVGMELKLYKNGTYAISHSQHSSGYVSQFMKDWEKHVKHTLAMLLTLPIACCCQENFLAYHGCKEYMDRFDKSAAGLKNIYLNELYRKQASLPSAE